jgi:nucleotide-binding universal stress UspA family protein
LRGLKTSPSAEARPIPARLPGRFRSLRRRAGLSCCRSCWSSEAIVGHASTRAAASARQAGALGRDFSSEGLSRPPCRYAPGVGPTTVGDQCWRRMFSPRCGPYRCGVVFGGPDFTIVVGFDGTLLAEDALALGEPLAVRGGARMVVLCVYLCRPLVSIGSGQQARTPAARAGALLGRRYGWESGAVPTPSVERGLLAAAAGRAVAIVLGSSRRRPGRRTRRERVVRSTADCPMTIAPLGFQAHVAGRLDAHAASR